jgi:hypothetical protein
MTLHFSYGSNMSRAIMRRHAPDARPIGVAELSGYRFVITVDGYASVVPARAHAVHGVLWRLTPRDVVTLNAWENVAGGLYRGATLAVDHAGGRARALVYLARRAAVGRPKLGYMELVIAAACEWNFPPAYIRSLRCWRPARRSDAHTATLREFG